MLRWVLQRVLQRNRTVEHALREMADARRELEGPGRNPSSTPYGTDADGYRADWWEHPLKAPIW